MRALLSVDKLTLTHSHLVKILEERYNSKNAIFVPLGVFDDPLPSCNLNGNRILIFGKMGPYKNLQLALTTFREINSINRNTELVVAGSSHPLHPGYLESIKRDHGIIPNVTYAGYVQEEKVSEIFMRSSIVLLPYTASVWSSAVFVLCAIYGRAVIASDLPDFRELRDQGAGVILFKSENKQDLFEKLTELLNDVPTQNKLGEMNLEWAKKNNFEGTIKTILGIFRQTVLG